MEPEFEGLMKLKPVLLGLSFLIAASMACSIGTRRVSPTATQPPILGGIQVATPSPIVTGIPVQMPTAVATSFPGTVVPTVPASIPQAEEIRQWAVSAAASSEYSNPDWAASQATGAPNVAECGDNALAWASRDDTTVDWLELTYATPVKPFEIDIYQTFNPGQIVKVELFSPDGQASYLVYTAAPAKVEACPQKLTLPLDGSSLAPVDRIRITIDQSVLGVGWGEIDAVELVGVR